VWGKQMFGGVEKTGFGVGCVGSGHR